MSLTIYNIKLGPVDLVNCNKYESAERLYTLMKKEGMNLYDLSGILILPKEIVQEINNIIEANDSVTKKTRGSLKSIWS